MEGTKIRHFNILDGHLHHLVRHKFRRVFQNILKMRGDRKKQTKQ